MLAHVHGNNATLEAVLVEPELQTCDRFIFAGDLVMNGPQPKKCLSRIMVLGCGGVIGNTDLEVLTGNDPVASWTRKRLSGDALEYLATLPTLHRITPTDDPFDDLVVVHATPRSSFDLLILEPHPLGTTFTEVTPEPEARAMMRGVEAGLLVFGHLHYASARRLGHVQVASLGSVGFPFDGDPRAAYAVAEWTGASWRLEHHRVAYDHEQVAQMLEASTIPSAARYAAMIRKARWLPRSHISDSFTG